MMNNLFSPFDPSNSLMSSNWLMMFLPMVIISSSKKMSNKANNMKKKMSSIFMKENEVVFQKMKYKESSKMMLCLFITLSMMNLMALIPSSFSTTAQISFNFPMAMSLWLTSNMFSAMKKTTKLMAHLVPTGTPLALMPLMVMIELTSNIIRPITLSVRLTANMVAGHILFSLSESMIQSGNSTFLASALMMSVLTFLETGVAIIQAYIFSTLISLYASENQ